jgi:hypothetical protein
MDKRHAKMIQKNTMSSELKLTTTLKEYEEDVLKLSLTKDEYDRYIRYRKAHSRPSGWTFTTNSKIKRQRTLNTDKLRTYQEKVIIDEALLNER